jgi:hypothetical protein
MDKQNRKKRASQTRAIPISDDICQAMLEQRQLFLEKFDDPLFFDPDADTPQPINEEKLRSDIVEALSEAGIDPVLVYAYHKTGLLVSEDNVHLLSAEDLEEWRQAVEEAKRLFQTNQA